MRIILTGIALACGLLCAAAPVADTASYPADHDYIRYTGRVDFSKAGQPKYWAPGVYFTFSFEGTYCVLLLNDEERWGKSHNYLQIQIDDQPSYRIQTTGKENRIVLASGLAPGRHTVIVCKNTEAGIGYIQPVSLLCEKLLPPPPAPSRRIEFIGNSITCGMGNDASAIACNTREWYDQHNAYMAYGPLTARKLNARWQLTAESGIGLIHSCCNKKTTMPQVFDKINVADDTIAWDFSRYQPDVVTVCLGQNDGIQDSTAFCNAYVQFLYHLRQYYPKAQIVLLSSPMAGDDLKKVLTGYITSVVNAMHREKDKKISSYFFSKRYDKGCDYHPNMDEHKEMADELAAYLKGLMKW
ncbi:MAG TPA: SGNH/GDSL hydrolase family protein [Chitinophagaceae bacterium]|nr:SGNH/GDSL hydrolase family protein [Chitinophagaceae bacterium]